MDRVILHSDLNNFYASVECLLHPELKGKCVAVCGSQETRHGIVLAKNDAAKAMGVKTAETIWQAKNKCPGLVTVSPHFEEYRKYSLLVRDIYKQYTDLIEPFGMDECWLDVTGSRLLFGDGVTIAERIRKEVKEKTGLTVSVGVSFNKIFAKLGSDMKKPDAVTEISKENFKSKVWCLPAGDIIGVGKATLSRLNALGIKTIGDIANTPQEFFEKRFGKMGAYLWKNANGLDDSPVCHQDYRAPAKSIGHGRTLKEDLVNNEEVWKVIFYLCRELENSLRSKSLMAATCSVSVKTSDLGVKEYQTPLKVPTHSAYEIALALFALFKHKHNWDKNVRAITVRAVKLSGENDDVQMSLFNDEKTDEKRENMEKTAYELENRFGKGSITYGSLLKNDKLPMKEEPDEEDLKK